MDNTKDCGYDSESDIEDMYCKFCYLMARRLTVTSCCGSSYCYACIKGLQLQEKPCITCGELSFDVHEQNKDDRLMEDLQVYCSLKGRGCPWVGTLLELETHLDPKLRGCNYLDRVCPLKCQITISRIKWKDHLTNECVRRPYTCQHCYQFKATYEEVELMHWPTCSHYPLPCPNNCGTTCKREELEDHMTACELEEVMCTFVGCKVSIKRKNLKEHSKEHKKKRLMTLRPTASGNKLDSRHKKRKSTIRVSKSTH